MSKNRYIWLNGEKIPVDDESYHDYYRSVWREAKRKKARANVERSYEQILKNGHDLQADSKLVDDIVADKMLLKELYVALAELTDDERSLIDALYYENRSIRDIAIAKGTNHTKVVRQHKRILQKLKKILKIF